MSSELSKEDEQKFTDKLKPLLSSDKIASAVAGIVGSVALGLIVTNYARKELFGDVEAKPTDSETTVNKAEVAGNETEGKLAKDGVNGTEGKIKANETKGIAATAEATAADNGAQALRNKTGAMDIESKGMEIQ